MSTPAPGLVRLADAPAIKGVDATRFKAFTDFHAEIAAKVEAHKDDAEFQAGSYSVHPIVGIRQPTLQSVELRDGKVKALRTYEGKDTDGDGTVPMQSATPLEWIDKHMEMFASERHASLQNFDAVLVQVDGLLRNETVRFREVPTQPQPRPRRHVRRRRARHARREGRQTRRAARRGDLRPHQRRGGGARVDDEQRRVAAARAGAAPAGTYGVELLGMGAPPADPVHDVFVVFGDDDVARATELEET